jgi:hypothetical protein
MGGRKSLYRILVRKALGNRPLVRPKMRWQDPDMGYEFLI